MNARTRLLLGGRYRSGVGRLASVAVTGLVVLAVFGLPRKAEAQAPPFPAEAQLRSQETIEVSRIIIDAHVFGFDGRNITDLGPDDFQVRVDGKEARIESVEWIYEVPTRELVEFDEDDNEVSRTIVPVPGRLFICFVQTDFARNRERVLGEMGVIRGFHNFVEILQPADRVALLSFDSHLKFRLDFTTDREQLEKVFPSVLLIDNPPPPPAVESPSLARLVTQQQMKDAGSSEAALILLARAMRQIDGPKNMILFGWGLGEPAWRQPWINPRIVRGGAELAAARVTVYTFNFGLRAQMKFGLQRVSADTGGFYSERNFLPQLQAALQGHYEIEVRNPVPSVPGNLHRIEVLTTRRALTVRAKTSFVDQP